MSPQRALELRLGKARGVPIFAIYTNPTDKRMLTDKSSEVKVDVKPDIFVNFSRHDRRVQNNALTELKLALQRTQENHAYNLPAWSELERIKALFVSEQNQAGLSQQVLPNANFLQAMISHARTEQDDCDQSMTLPKDRSLADRVRTELLGASLRVNLAASGGGLPRGRETSAALVCIVTTNWIEHVSRRQGCCYQELEEALQNPHVRVIPFIPHGENPDDIKERLLRLFGPKVDWVVEGNSGWMSAMEKIIDRIKNNRPVKAAEDAAATIAQDSDEPCRLQLARSVSELSRVYSAPHLSIALSPSSTNRLERANSGPVTSTASGDSVQLMAGQWRQSKAPESAQNKPLDCFELSQSAALRQSCSELEVDAAMRCSSTFGTRGEDEDLGEFTSELPRAATEATQNAVSMEDGVPCQQPQQQQVSSGQMEQAQMRRIKCETDQLLKVQYHAHVEKVEVLMARFENGGSRFTESALRREMKLLNEICNELGMDPFDIDEVIPNA